MQTFDQHLMDLVADGTVAYDIALAAASRPADFQLRVNMFRSAGTAAPAGRRTPASAAPPVRPAVVTPDNLPAQGDSLGLQSDDPFGLGTLRGATATEGVK